MRTLSWGKRDTIDYVEKELHEGKVILAEGDTVLGLLADVSEKGVAQLNHIKSRSHKPYLILVENSKKVFDFIEIDKVKVFQIEKFMHKCWPGPVTLIFKAKEGVFPPAQTPEGTIAIRVPNHQGLLQLLSRFDALFSTSANSSGQPVPGSIEEVDTSILGAVACVVTNDDHSTAQSELPSTIIDCTGERPVVVRQGAFDASKLVDIFD